MQIKIMDYRQQEKLVEIGDLKDIETIAIQVISGDEYWRSNTRMTERI